MRRIRSLLCPALAWLAASPVLCGQEIQPGAPLELPVPAALLSEASEYWYGVYMNGTKAGWAVDATSPVERNGKPHVESRMQMNLDIKALGQVTRMEMDTRTLFSTTGAQRAMEIRETQKMSGQEREIVLKHLEGQTYEVSITEAGQVRREKQENLDFRLTHAVSPELWSTDPARKAGDRMYAVEFSSDVMKLTSQTLTITRETDWAAPGGKLAAWEVDIYDHDHKMKMTALVSRADGTMVKAVLGQVFELRAEPEHVAKAERSGELPDFFEEVSIRSDRKLGESPQLTELEIELTAPEGKPLPDLPDTVNQKVTRSADGRSLNISITPGSAPPVKATDAEREENLKATPRYPADQEKVKALAARAVKGATDDRQKVQRLLKFTDRHIPDHLGGEALTVMDLLEKPRGDCSAHALLFTALARAAGIPAREAGGWMYMGDDYQTFGGHAWNEVILDGHWVPVDPTWTQMQLDAGHIQEHGGGNDGRMLESMIPGLKARVISVKKKK